MNTWATRHSWIDARGDIRYNEFKSQYPKAIFINEEGKRSSITKHKDFNSIKQYFKIYKNCATPQTAKLKIFPDGDIKREPVEFITLERKSTNDGSRAQKMEVLVAIASLIPIKDYKEFLKIIKNKELLFKLQGITHQDILNVKDAVGCDYNYADKFLQVSQQIRKIPNMKYFNSYSVLNRNVWSSLKGHASALLSKDLNLGTLRGDKWNPADVLFIKDNFKLIKLLECADINSLNSVFDSWVLDGTIVPVSIKMDSNAIYGSKSIERYIQDSIKNIEQYSILEFMQNYQKVPVSIKVSKTIKDNDLHCKVLNWIHNCCTEQLSKIAACALGTIPKSSSWYTANNEQVISMLQTDKKIPKFNEIVIGTRTQQVWLKFNDDYLSCRTKGSHAIHLSADGFNPGVGLTYNELQKEKITKKQAVFLGT